MGQTYNQSDTWDGDHYDPTPWKNTGLDWFFADSTHVGNDRTLSSNSGYLNQYPEILREAYNDPHTCPEDYYYFS